MLQDSDFEIGVLVARFGVVLSHHLVRKGEVLEHVFSHVEFGVVV